MFKLLVLRDSPLSDEARLIVEFMRFEGITLKIEVTPETLYLTRGRATLVVLDETGTIIGGFYKLIDHVRSKGLTRC